MSDGGVEFTLDTAAFQAEFYKRVMRSQKTLAELVNQAAFRIAQRAYEFTHKGNLAEIESLGVTYITHGKKGKELKRKKSVFTPTTRFKLIALKEMWRGGASPRSYANAAALDEAIRKKLARRKSSIGFIAAGFVPAMRALIRFIHAGGITRLKLFPGTKGSGQPAQESSWSPFAIIENASGMDKPNQTEASKARVEKFLTEAVQKAFDAEAAELASYEQQLNAALE